MDISLDFYDNLELKPVFKKRKREESTFDNKAHDLIPDFLGETAVIFCANSGKKNSYSQILFIWVCVLQSYCVSNNNNNEC